LAEIKTVLVANGEPTEDEAIGNVILSIGAATIPFGLGTLVKGIIGAQQKGARVEGLIASQTLYQRYSADIQELAQIKKQIRDEYVAAGKNSGFVPTGFVPTNEADTTPDNTLLYVGLGTAALILFLLWLKQRNRKKRK